MEMVNDAEILGFSALDFLLASCGNDATSEEARLPIGLVVLEESSSIFG